MIPFPFQAGQLGRSGRVASAPTNPDAFFSNVSLLLHMDGPDATTSFIDASLLPKTATVFGNAQIDGLSRFGNGSYLGDGTGDYLSFADSTAFGFGSSQYTIEMWVRIPALLTTTHYLVDIRKSGGVGVGVALDSLERVIVVDNAGTILQGATGLAINAWHHIAVTRDVSNVLRIFINGVVDASVTDSRTMDSTCPAYVGATLIGTASLSGRIDELRITKGVARYTGTFTPPTEPFPFSANQIALLFGDSITAGVGASTLANSWAGLFGTNYAVTNCARSGDQAADQSAEIQANHTPSSSRRYALMVGTNDHRTYRTDTAKQVAFKSFFRQCVGWLTLPTKKTARDGSVTYTGTWADTSVNNIGRNTSSLGAKASTTFNGTGVLVGFIIQDDLAAQSTATVKIDGASMGTLSSYAAMTTVNGKTFAPAAAYFGGLSSGAHTIEIENTVGGEIFYLDYFAEMDQPALPIVISNIIKMTAGAYTTFTTSEANVILYNTLIDDVIAEFAAHGITLPLVDNFNDIDPATHLPDGVHPNDTGHSIIYANFQTAL